MELVVCTTEERVNKIKDLNTDRERGALSEKMMNMIVDINDIIIKTVGNLQLALSNIILVSICKERVRV